MSEVLIAELDVANRIEARTRELTTGERLVFPSADDALIKDYVLNLQGRCDASQARDNIDQARTLLYVAFNTVPQEEGAIRVGINRVMVRLIELQQRSELVMRETDRVSQSIGRMLSDVSPDWNDGLESQDLGELKSFVGKDLVKLAQAIGRHAGNVGQSLDDIAQRYTQVIIDAQHAFAQGQSVLAQNLDNRDEVLGEIAAADAARKRLDGFARSLGEEIQAFERQASEYKGQAEPAGEPSCIMQRVNEFAWLVTTTIPAIAAESTAASAAAVRGKVSLVAGAGASTLRHLPVAGQPAEDGGADSTAQTSEQQSKAASLRELQLQTLENIAAYVQAQSEENAGLAEVIALLTASRNHQQTRRLAIMILGRNISALQRLRDTVAEIAYLLRSMASFMPLVIERSQAQVRELAATEPHGSWTSSSVTRIKRETSDFLVSQYAQWTAISVLSKALQENFAEGWSRLNKVSGTYLNGSELQAYLSRAAATLAGIAERREQACQAKRVKFEYLRQGDW